MNGIRIIGKGVPGEGKSYHIDYRFDEIVSPIAHIISSYYWLLDDVNFQHNAYDGETFDDYQEKFDEIIIQNDFGLMLTIMGFLNKYSQFVRSFSASLTSSRLHSYF